jgi:hypothetical protein
MALEIRIAAKEKKLADAKALVVQYTRELEALKQQRSVPVQREPRNRSASPDTTPLRARSRRQRSRSRSPRAAAAASAAVPPAIHRVAAKLEQLERRLAPAPEPARALSSTVNGLFEGLGFLMGKPPSVPGTVVKVSAEELAANPFRPNGSVNGREREGAVICAASFGPSEPFRMRWNKHVYRVSAKSSHLQTKTGIKVDGVDHVLE